MTDTEPPDSFFCPISYELMRDPVVTADGHTYEREQIAIWFAQGHDTSPRTNAVLEHVNVVPNTALRQAIEAWEEGNIARRLVIPRSALTELEERPSAAGSFKTMYRGKLSLQMAGRVLPNAPPEARDAVDVAVLSMRAGTVESEARVFLKLGRHPRIVRFFGQCVDGDNQMLVMELAPRGSLDALMEDLADQGMEEALTAAHKLAMVQQICSGMEALEAEGILHRDLAARNVLVFGFDADDVSATSVKLTDFGLAVSAYGRTHQTVAGNELPIRYLPPESLMRRRFSTKSDVWAFGITAFEIYSDGDQPYFEITSDDDVVAHVTGGGRLGRPDACPAEVWEVIASC